MDKKHQKCPKNGGFHQFATPQDFFQKSASVTFAPTDQRTTDKGDYSGTPGV